MKLVKFLYDKRKSATQNAIDTATLHCIAYGKVYELLHKQIWRKDASRVARYTIPAYPTHYGRPVAFVSLWNIKSGSTAPYSYEGDANTFGLNQLFMGQDYRKPYVGNPKDGIYHDDCYIAPKAIAIKIEKEAWRYEEREPNVENPYVYTKIYRRQSDNGAILIDNVTASQTLAFGTTYIITITIFNHDGTQTIEERYIDLGIYNYTLVYDKIHNLSEVEYYYVRPDFDALHGDTLYYDAHVNNGGGYVYGWIKIYKDGTAIEYVPSYYVDENTGAQEECYRVLPMIYTDTGDMVMDRIEFVEKWSDYFELIVHEDSEFWEVLVKPVSAILTIVVASYTGIILNPFGTIGTGLSVIGTLGGNKNMSLIGGALMAGAGIYNTIEQGYATSLMQSGVFPDRAEALLQDATFSELFQGFVSSAGMGNLTQIGSDVFNIGTDINSFATQIDTTTSNTAEDETLKQVYVVLGNEDEFDPQRVIDSVVEI